ncbi:MAG: hypothetical protein FWG34_10455 [Oscillospiraceae bacterium]|nr:hypothetical protein [Oscillospiraceae bacterium]
MEEKKSPSKLNDLFEDLQDTLDSSIYNANEDESEKPKKPEIPEIADFPEPQKPPPAKKYADEKESRNENENQEKRFESADKQPENVIWEERENDGGESEQSDMDLELLKAIGIGREEAADGKKRPRENYADPEKSGAENKSDPKEYEKNPVSKKPPQKTFYRATEKEFANREQITDIFASYRNEYISALIKFAAGAVLFLIIFYMETAPYLKWKMPGILNIYHYNVPYIWIDMQILLLAAAINGKSLVYGVRSMFASNVNAYSISVFFLAVSFVHTMLTLNFRYNSPEMALYNSMAVYSMVMISLYNLFDIIAEIDSFKTVSSNKQKYALTLLDPSKTPKTAPLQASSQPYGTAKPEAELFRDVAAYGSGVGGVVSAPFVSNFFTRTYKDKHLGGPIKHYIYISLFAALSLFIITMGLNKEKDWYASLSCAAAIMLGSVPLCSFVACSYPVFKAQKKARQIGAAFIGGNSMEESSGMPIISVYDKDIFPAEKVRISGIKVCKDVRIDAVMQTLCAIFDKLNMPPAETFKASVNYDGNGERDVKLAGIEDDGICFFSSGAKMFIGKRGYMANLGLDPFSSDVDEAFEKSLGSIMFLAAENKLLAKIYITYEISPDFYDIIKNIRKVNTCLCIRTFDPNINDELVAAMGNIKKYPVRVLKLKDSSDIYKIPGYVDSPVVSKESLKSLFGAVVIADKIKTLMKTNAMLQTLAFSAGLLLSVILGVAGQLLGINAGHLFLFQTFWMLPVIVLSGLN